ncbi:hypothetical protein [Nocardia sp. MW-W600-9]
MRNDQTWPDALPDTAPVIHRNLQVTVGARTLTTLTRSQLTYWLGNLRFARGGPFMTVSREPGAGAFIQTYRHSDSEYFLETHAAGDDALSSTTLSDVDLIGRLIWDWLEDDHQCLDVIAWERQQIH